MVGLYYVLMVLFLVICVFMMLLVLIQKGRGGGLAGAFGGSGGNTAFGTKTGDVLTWATSIVFGIFLLLAVFLNLVANQIGTPKGGASTVQHSTSGSGGSPPANDIPPPMPIGG